MSNHTDPNTRTAAQNVKHLLVDRYGFLHSDFRVRTIPGPNLAVVSSPDLPILRNLSSAARCLRSSGLQVVEHTDHLVVEA